MSSPSSRITFVLGPGDTEQALLAFGSKESLDSAPPEQIRGVIMDIMAPDGAVVALGPDLSFGGESLLPYLDPAALEHMRIKPEK